MGSARETLTTPESIFWMVEQLLEHRRFSYADWVDRFRDGDLPGYRNDRKFFTHLGFLKTRALGILSPGRAFTLECDENQVYHLKGDRGEALELSDEAWANYFPLFYGLNQRSSLVPFPVKALEKQLEEAFDPPEALKNRVIYKNQFSWRMTKDHLTTFYDAVQEGVQLEADQQGRPTRPFTPLFLVNFDGNWHLVGQDQKRLQQFNLSRVTGLRKTDRPGTVSRQDLDRLRQRIQEVHGIHLLPPTTDGGKPWEVTVRYQGKALVYARERFDPQHRHPNDPWFEASSEQDSLVVRLKTNDLAPIVSELLAWGADALPVAPVALCEAWKTRVKELAALAGN